MTKDATSLDLIHQRKRLALQVPWALKQVKICLSDKTVKKNIYVICSMLSLCRAHVGLCRAHVGPCSAYVHSCWAYIGPVLGHVEPCWAYIGPMLGLTWDHVGRMLGHIEPNLATQPILGSLKDVETQDSRAKVHLIAIAIASGCLPTRNTSAPSLRAVLMNLKSLRRSKLRFK